VDTNPQTAQMSIVLNCEIFLLNLNNSKMFLHETMINVLVVQELLKAGTKIKSLKRT
jgi:hypothetical protein